LLLGIWTPARAAYCVITDIRRDCHYSFLRDCQKAAARVGGICQEGERERNVLPRMGRIETPPEVEYDPFEEGRQRAEERRRNKKANMERAEFILQLEEKSAEWDVKFPDRENPYERELKRIGERK